MLNRFEGKPQSIGKKENKVRSSLRILTDVPLTMGLLMREAFLHPGRAVVIFRGTKTSAPKIMPKNNCF